MANCKFEKQQYRYSNDNGVTWYNVVPERFEAGNLIEYDSVDCSSMDTLYKWTLLEGEYICEDNVKYKKEIRYDSYDGGSTWYVTYPLVYRAGERVGIDEEFCSYKYEGHYIDDSGEDSRCPKGYIWNGARCVKVDPLKVAKCDGNTVLSSGDTKYYANGYKVTSATIGDCVRTISAKTFAYCDRLTNVFIPNGVTSIGNEVFRGCSSLTSVTIPDSVTSIGYQAFGYCSSLRSATIGSGVTTISTFLFMYCTSLTSCTIGNSVTSIGSYAFENCISLTSINIPSGVTSLANNVFYDCYSLTSIDIPDSVTTIGSDAFANCSGLTSVTIGNGVTSIGSYAFENCSGLTSITVNATTPPTLGSGPFENTNNCPIYVPCESVNAYKSASGWSNYSSRITCTSLLKFKATYSDETTYSASCDSSASITYNEVRPSGYTYSAMTNAVIGYCVTSIGQNAFYQCSSLTSITIPDSVIKIANNVFYGCSGLTSITIPDSVTSIGSGAFQYCSGLTSINIPSGVTTIGTRAFKNCSGLTSITINATTPPTLGSEVFENTNNCPIYVPCESVEVYKSASGWSNYSSRITCRTKFKATYSDETTYSAKCDSSTSLTQSDVRPSGYTYSAMTEAEIGDCVTSIEEYTFSDCRSLTSINILSGVTSIKDYAFRNCTSLTGITINATTPPTLGRSAFSLSTNCPIYVPSASVETYKSASVWSTYADRIQAIP